jgi:type IV secretion system protein VirB10
MTDHEKFPVPEVQNKAPKPPGVLPRNTQARVLGAIALLMVAVIAFSGRNAPKERTKAPALPPPAVDPNQARIQEYRARIEEQARKLAAEQAELAHAKQALALQAGPGPGRAPEGGGAVASTRMHPPAGSVRPIEYAGRAERGWIDVDREKREYESLYASNIVLTYREKAAGPTVRGASAGTPIPAFPNAYPPWAWPPGAISPSLPQGANFQAPAPPSVAGPNTASPSGGSSGVEAPAAEKAPKDPAARGEAGPDAAQGRRYRLFEGTVLETVLTNRLDGGFSGPVNCLVTTNIYSHDRQRLLIPQGSRVLGEVRRVETFGQERLAVSFHRLIMPDGYSVSLDQFQGLNQVGETGLRDKVNHHYLRVFGVSLAIGAIAGLSQANTRYGFDTSAEDAYRQGVANSLSQSSLRILDRYLNVLPTFTIREGHRVKVYLSNDLLLPAYEKHQMPSDL